MALERGLGRGLGALLGDAALQSQEGGSLSLPISQVEPGLKQPRKRFDEESLQDLADSIRIHGIIQPLTVRRLSSGYYQIIAGERRWRRSSLFMFRWNLGRQAGGPERNPRRHHRGRRPQGDGARPDRKPPAGGSEPD